MSPFLQGLLYLAGPEAAGADLNSFNRAFFQYLDALKIRVELPGADVMSVRNRIAEYGFLFANIALLGHTIYSYQSGECYQSSALKSIHNVLTLTAYAPVCLRCRMNSPVIDMWMSLKQQLVF
jgi:hypothetical protein